MSAASLKQAIAELIRAGYRVERVAHASGVVTFAGPDGRRWALIVGRAACRLAGTNPATPPSDHHTIADALRALATAPTPVG